MEAMMRVTDTLKSFRVRLFRTPLRSSDHGLFIAPFQEARLSSLRAPTEFFDVNRISRPADLNQATHVRISLAAPGCLG